MCRLSSTRKTQYDKSIKFYNYYYYSYYYYYYYYDYDDPEREML